ncbi:MAG: DUF6006 family protein [Cyanobacteria bacterium P01_A01_bin.116]
MTCSFEKKKNTMKQIYRYWLVAAIIFATVLGIAFAHSVQAATYARPTQTSVIPPDWVGTWDCNLDGREAVIRLGIDSRRGCDGDFCTTTPGAGPIAGNVSDGGGNWVPIRERSRNSNDLDTSRNDHTLPLRYNGTDDWMLIMHTWNRDFASGYTTWRGIPFGLQCSKR